MEENAVRLTAAIPAQQLAATLQTAVVPSLSRTLLS